MAQSYLIFDFGGNEKAAQQARHKVDSWRQAFRLDQKLLLRFDRGDSAAAADDAMSTAAGSKDAAGSDAKKKAASTARGAAGKAGDAAQSAEAAGPAERIQVMVRLDFSDHEKLSHQRWLERIPGEEPFKSASPQTVRPGDAAHAAAAERFDGLAVAESRPMK